MTTLQANASPEKSLFLDMFIRDLSLEDCILDLVDNSIDALIRSRNINVSEALIPLATNSSRHKPKEATLEPAVIEVTYDAKNFKIVDNCGGISVKDAAEEVFRFGHSKKAVVGQLGVYGIGLKRAIFKIGNDITIESKTKDEGFRMHIPVPSWSNDPNWTLPFEVIAGTGDSNVAGTSISIKDFGVEVTERFKSGTFEGHLTEMIARTYCLFLNRYVVVILNGHKVEPSPIPLGKSEDANVAKEEFEDSGVKVTLYAGLAARDPTGEWRAIDAGWYVLCNGRLVVTASRTEETGWGAGMPTFVPKYRGFIGLAFFYSTNPLLLPWKTTKQGLNQESLVFQRARTRMATIGRPVLSFLDKMYSSQEIEHEAQRQVAAGIKPLDVRDLTAKPQVTFKTIVKPPGEITVRVQYSAKQSELNRVKKSLGKNTWPATRIGRYTFDHYLKTECPE
jgi:hypothetical protein